MGREGGAMLDRARRRSHVFGRAAEPGPQGVIGAMQLSVTGKQTEIGESLRRHIEGSLGSILGKYFKTAIEAHVIVSKEAHLSRAEISIHIGRGIAPIIGASSDRVWAKASSGGRYCATSTSPCSAAKWSACSAPTARERPPVFTSSPV
ncbi:MAG: ribosome-associated translation inhibitor RaiA [Alphaproteobacteria bacterium]|nr:MAG: ribosome-associated translation inhibitor RaiA [Alphaproteobacteria bacterium]